ncbi:MAG TPA: histidine phosphatase family protein [Noviherbaspirillum sp.]|nr:histidine phosphatase family protein [Noviherbaspirillum sp.]
MGQIYLIRHGQASFGSADYDALSALGEEQARLLGRWFAHAGQRFSCVLSGDLKRQRQTAALCMETLYGSDVPVCEVDGGFNEYDHHEVLVRQRPEFADPNEVRRFLAASANPRAAFQDVFAAAMSRWMSGRHNAEYGETWPQFSARCVAAVERLFERGRGQTIAVFTSGGTISAICQRVLGMSDAHTARLSWGLVNSGVTRLLYQPGQLSLSYLNSYAHLEWQGRADALTWR